MFDPFGVPAKDFINAIYRRVLGREPDEQGKLLQKGLSVRFDEETISSVLESLLESEEFNNGRMRSLILKMVGRENCIGSRVTYSLGERCFTSWLLKNTGNKNRSGPFDWIFSSPDMALDLIDNQFKNFLDPAYHLTTPLEQRDAPNINKSSNLYYEQHFGIKNVYNHHDILTPDNLNYFRRGVDRFLYDLKNEASTRLIMVHTGKSIDDNYISKLIEALCRISNKFSILMVSISSSQMYDRNFSMISSSPKHVHVHFRATSSLGPLNFQDPVDDIVFTRGILGYLRSLGDNN